eukprot:10092539-Ditylum_brightwellii.AAC.1
MMQRPKIEKAIKQLAKQLVMLGAAKTNEFLNSVLDLFGTKIEEVLEVQKQIMDEEEIKY